MHEQGEEELDEEDDQYDDIETIDRQEEGDSAADSEEYQDEGYCSEDCSHDSTQMQ
jgi:hypothetical protein